jgi:hypothetical protein
MGCLCVSCWDEFAAALLGLAVTGRIALLCRRFRYFLVLPGKYQHHRQRHQQCGACAENDVEPGQVWQRAWHEDCSGSMAANAAATPNAISYTAGAAAGLYEISWPSSLALFIRAYVLNSNNDKDEWHNGNHVGVCGKQPPGPYYKLGLWPATGAHTYHQSLVIGRRYKRCGQRPTGALALQLGFSPVMH